MLTLLQTTSKTMGDLCRKAGEKVSAEIVSTLRTKATSPDARTREGVCIAIADLVYVLRQPSLSSTHPMGTGKIHLILNGNNTKTILSPRARFPSGRRLQFRGVAANAFNVFPEYMRAKAVVQTRPTLLDALRQPGNSSGTALQVRRKS